MITFQTMLAIRLVAAGKDATKPHLYDPLTLELIDPGKPVVRLDRVDSHGRPIATSRPERVARPSTTEAPSPTAGCRTPPRSLVATRPLHAPRAPWWRRWWAAVCGHQQRLDLRRRRHAFARVYAQATWGQCRRAALLERDVDRRAGLSRAFADCSLHNHLKTMGPRVDSLSEQPC